MWSLGPFDFSIWKLEPPAPLFGGVIPNASVIAR
jgi:hypothetical protein